MNKYFAPTTYGSNMVKDIEGKLTQFNKQLDLFEKTIDLVNKNDYTVDTVYIDTYMADWINRY